MTTKILFPTFLIGILPLLVACPAEPEDCSYNPCAPGCPSIPTCEDDEADAGQKTTVNCSDVDSIVKGWGGSTGPCGPESSITVTAEGDVTKSIGSAEPPAGQTDCADPTVTTYAASPTSARTLLDTVCEDFNTNYVEPEELPDGAYTGWGFFQGETLLANAKTDLPASSNALDSFMAGLTPISPTETTDAGVTETDGGN